MRRHSLRKPVMLRVMELLTHRAAIWIVGLSLGGVTLVIMTVFDKTLAWILLVPLAVAGATAIIIKDRAVIVRRRVLFKGEVISRRQAFSVMLAVFLTAGATAWAGSFLGASIVDNYNERIRRHLRRKPKPPEGQRPPSR
jgi:hypothetical protein